VAWNNPSSALHAGVLPSFLYGRGAQNWWLAHEVLSSEMRLFFDASSLVLGLYPESISSMQHVMASSKNGRLTSVSWEYDVNHHLATVYGSYCCQSPARRFPMLHRVVKQSEDYMLSKVDTLVSSDFFISKHCGENEKHRTYKATHFIVYTILKYSIESLCTQRLERKK
jgi:beta-arabinofuranosyltransferase